MTIEGSSDLHTGLTNRSIGVSSPSWEHGPDEIDRAGLLLSLIQGCCAPLPGALGSCVMVESCSYGVYDWGHRRRSPMRSWRSTGLAIINLN